MSVGRLSGVWVLEVLRSGYPDGVVRRALLDDFSKLLVTSRSSQGAKGRLAKKLYSKLTLLQRKGQIAMEDGIVHLVNAERRTGVREEVPLLGVILQKKLFLALMAEDRPEEPGRKAQMQAARWGFLGAAVEQGWTVAQAAGVLGIRPGQALEVLAKPPRTS